MRSAMLNWAGLVVIPSLLTAKALAHELERSLQETWWLAWNFDPLLLVPLGVSAFMYRKGVDTIWRRLGPGNGIRRWQLWSFWGAIAALVIALLSPMDAISYQLAYIHMIQHMVLMLVAAPLLVLASPMTAVYCALPNPWRRKFSRVYSTIQRLAVPRGFFWQIALVWLVHALVLWAWHIPWLYLAALRFELIHYLQHLMFFWIAFLFWKVIMDPFRRLTRQQTLGIIYLFTSSLHAAALGVLMALAQAPWYQDYTLTTKYWGLSALEDQQIAGLIMWMPACAVYAFFAAVLLAQALKRIDGEWSSESRGA